jgi:eukaryotic-like serine/threonine-protein kinase
MKTSNHLAAASWMELAFGNKERALEGARRVFARKPGYDPTLRAALTLAMCGCEDEAQVITDELTKAHPEHTIINSVLAPIVRAGIALAKGEPSQAITELQGVVQYELGFCAVLAPLYLRAEAYLQQGSREEAAQEFHRIVNHRGSEPFSPFYAVAPRSLTRAGELASTSRGATTGFSSG